MAGGIVRGVLEVPDSADKGPEADIDDATAGWEPERGCREFRYRLSRGSLVPTRVHPTHGQYTTIRDYANSGIQWFATPGGWQDAVLVLETPGASSPASLTVAPGTIGAGGTVTVSWAGVSGATVTDWIGLYPTGAGEGARLDWRYTE